MSLSVQDTLFQSLPQVYQKEGKGSLTYRLLGLFGEVLERLEDKILGLHRQLNPLETDSEFLPWLASWVSFVLDETWEESKRRQLIARIVLLYRLRGTEQGLRAFVEIYTGIKPDIIEESLDGWRVGFTSTVGEDLRVFGTFQENAHRFSVLVKTFEIFDDERKAKIRERVLIEKPAHTQLVHVAFFPSFWRIGVRSTLGVDTKMGG